MTEGRTSRFGFLWYLVPIAAVVALGFGDLWAGAGWVARDTSNLLYVIRRWHADTILARGSIPLWNGYLFSGLSQLANPQNGLFTPLGFLYLVFDGYLAHQLYILCMLGLGASGMALWVNALIDDRRRAAFWGICYLLGGVVLSSVPNLVYLTGACLLPWVLWRYSCFRRRPGPGSFLWLALSMAWMVLEGDPIAGLWISVFLVADAAVASVRQRSFAVLGPLGAGLLAIGLTAFATFPSLDFMEETRRAGQLAFEQTSYFSMPVERVLNLLVPAYWGRFGDGSFWGQALVHPRLPFNPRFWFDSIYLGIPVLFLCLVGAVDAFRARRNRLLVGFALGFVLLAFGDNFFLHRIFYQVVPFYGKIRFPAKFFAYANVLLFALAALGLKRILDSAGKRMLTGTLGGIAGLFALSVVLNLLLSPGAGQLLGIAPAGADQARALLNRNLLGAGLLGAAGLLGLVLIRIRARQGAAIKPLAGALVTAICLADLLLWIPPRRTDPLERLDRPSRLGSFLRERFGPWIKILRDANLNRFPGPRASTSRRESLDFNWGMLEQVPYAFGYEPTVPARMDALMGRQAFQRFDTWGRLLGVTHVLTTMRPASVQVRRLLETGRLRVAGTFQPENTVVLEATRPGSHFEAHPACRLVAGPREARKTLLQLGADREAAVVETRPVLYQGRKTEAPRHLDRLARWPGSASGPGGAKIRLLEKTPGLRSFSLELEDSRFLVIRDTFSPGWRARLDGREVPIYRADYLHLGVLLEPGAKTLTLEYAPPGLATGIVLSLIAWLAVALLALFGFFQKRRKRSAGPLAGQHHPGGSQQNAEVQLE